MRRLLLALLIGSAILAQPSTVAASPGGLDTDAIDAYVEGYLDRHGLAGAEVAVVRDGETVHTAAYGGNDDAATTTRTPMATGSTGKSITAFAVLQLVEAGKVALDDPVVTHLPEFALDDKRVDDITVRQILSHTSGMPSPIIVAPAATLTEGVARLQDWELAADPGQKYLYSNMNYHLAGRLVEVVSGTSFASYLEQNLFAPLGMDDTHSVNTTRDETPGLHGGHVTAYGLTVHAEEMEQLIAGAGSIITTAEDMAKWLGMLTRDGEASDGTRLLPAKLLDEAQSPQPNANGNGLGWQLSSPGVDPPRVGHSGATSRYSAQLDVVPDSGYGVSVMLNSFTPTFEHNYAISSGIIDITEGRTPELGTPVPTLMDAGLGVVTLLVIGLSVLGVRRAKRWAARRRSWPAWRVALRLLPQLIGPVLAIMLFGVVPALKNNPATPIDILFFWPAFMVLMLALGASGVALIAARVLSRARLGAVEASALLPGRVVRDFSALVGAPFDRRGWT